ncbi:MAG TPA: tetratricopeptide repeat protein [Bryobacteraceae bacterium]|nr:tetratricopeptide repeat protein [Bryobacteraceae bacterium]
MRLRTFGISAAVLCLALPLAAQNPPKPKSQKESDALQKVLQAQQAQNWDGEIQAINNVLENFADTEYKNLLLSMAVDAAQNKGDYAQTIAFGEQAVQADPNNITARVTMAEDIAQHTRENDLDKEQSLKKVDDLANKALDLLKNASTPPPGMNPAAWPDTKKLLTSQSYDALGQAADLRKNYPTAITDFKTAIDTDPSNSVAVARLAKAYVDNKQYDDGITTADKVLAISDAPAPVKTFAQQQKDIATKLKGAAK